jgi:hypothetical protein
MIYQLVMSCVYESSTSEEMIMMNWHASMGVDGLVLQPWPVHQYSLVVQKKAGH